MAAMADKENAGGTLTDEEKKNMQIRCLHCARDNTITTKNTWAMDLIDYLPELVSPEDGQQTNFQRASVTLDAGVKIYSYRVDSVHTETFKILGGLGRASNPTDDEDAGELGDGGGGDDDGEESGKRRRRTHELNPQSTLESSLEALNVKKFDLAFTVDPLFHKTSAQFDEGGARGLLLNNLSVYCGCDIVFDSLDVPENALDGARPADAAATVHLGSLQQQLAALQLASGGERISPTLDAILELLDESPAEDAAAAAEEFVAQVAASATSNGGDSTSLFRPWAQQVVASSGDAQAALGADDGGEQQQQEAEVGMEGVAAEYAYGAAPAAPVDADDDFYDAGDDFGGGGDDYYSDGGEDAQQSIVPGVNGGAAAAAGAGGAAQAAAAGYAASHDDLLGEDAIQWLIEAGSNGMVTRAKGWAGASHWKYRAVPQPVAEDEEGGEEGVTRPKKRSGTRRKNDPLDFVALMEQQQGAEAAAEPVFELMPRREPGAPKKARRAKPAAKTLLPEDHHFDVASLNRYALRPHTAIIAGSSGAGEGTAPMAAGAAAGAGGDVGFGGGLGGFDFGGGGNDDDDDDYENDMGGGDFGDSWGDAGELSMAEGGEALEMVQATRRVERVEVNYSRAAKQVDVRSLKELMWRGMHSTLPADAPPSPDTVLQFQDVLATVPEQNAAGRLGDLSVHLCFICVLHLANEHGLAIQSVPELDRLLISNVPTANS